MSTPDNERVTREISLGSLVSEEDRAALYKRLEEIGLEQETVLVMFENSNSMLAEVPLDSDSDQPKSLLVKPAGHAIKVSSKSGSIHS